MRQLLIKLALKVLDFLGHEDAEWRLSVYDFPLQGTYWANDRLGAKYSAETREVPVDGGRLVQVRHYAAVKSGAVGAVDVVSVIEFVPHDSEDSYGAVVDRLLVKARFLAASGKR